MNYVKFTVVMASSIVLTQYLEAIEKCSSQLDAPQWLSGYGDVAVAVKAERRHGKVLKAYQVA